MSFDLSNYVDVKTRIKQFKELYPEGSLQPANPAEPYRIEYIADRCFIIFVAAAYRNPNDPKPGIGCAMEPFPGRTNYTKDSELMNCETSAWGRAIIAALATDTSQGIASMEEVRNRMDDDADDRPVHSSRPQKSFKGGKGDGKITPNQAKFLGQLQDQIKLDDKQVADIGGAETINELSASQASKLVDTLLAVKRGALKVRLTVDNLWVAEPAEGE